MNKSLQLNSFFDLLKNSISYALKKPSIIIILGIYSVLLSLSEELVELNLISISLLLVLVVIILIFTIYESGYSFMIYFESIKGANSPPNPFNFKHILHHGITDFIVTILYAILMTIILIFGIFPNEFIIELISFILIAVLFCVLNAALINLAYNNGNFYSAFNFKEISQLLKKVGFFRFLFILVLFLIFEELIIGKFTSSTFLINLIINFVEAFLLAPIFLLVSKRMYVLSTLY